MAPATGQWGGLPRATLKADAGSSPRITRPIAFIMVRPDIGTPVAAGGADEHILEIHPIE